MHIIAEKNVFKVFQNLKTWKQKKCLALKQLSFSADIKAFKKKKKKICILVCSTNFLELMPLHFFAYWTTSITYATLNIF